MLFCVGDFFGENTANNDEWMCYRNGIKRAPIPTYILGPNNLQDCKQYTSVSLDDGFEFCENITYLGLYIDRFTDVCSMYYVDIQNEENILLP